jgi:glyoxylase-like metal-dependent hydrolase (beta-lactamase superfamily II)/8-oxo-dGTP pyrophosphatase MutT (NUDIX family)
VSELLPGFVLPPPAPPVKPVPAAVVILWREAGGQREVFWVRRGTPLRFAGGFYAFPGGKIDPGDGAIAVRGAPPGESTRIAAAVRELFEEVGVLAADGAERLDPATRDRERRALLDGSLSFAALLERHRLTLDAGPFRYAGRWITPPGSPMRFDARFYMLRMPAGAEACVWDGELSAGEWISTAGALDRWRSGEALLHPPALWPLQCLHRVGPPECIALMQAPPQTEDFVTRRLEFQEGLFFAPLRTPTLPPATHTNTMLPVIDGGLAVIDPGSPYPEEQAELERLLDEYAAEGLPPREIWLTHAHVDHVGGVARLRARYGIPVRAHPDAAAHLPAEVGAILPIADGERLSSRWRALHTPGHAHGHLAFHDERANALVAGDLVSTLSTIVIDPPEGDMSLYLASLQRVRALAPRTVYPAHGPPAPAGAQKIEEYVAHRLARETKVVAALASPGTLEEVTARAYDDTPEFLHPVAARSCLASLRKLVSEGRARESGGRWQLA